MEKVLFTAQPGDISWRDYVRQLLGRLHCLGPESSQLASNLYSIQYVLYYVKKLTMYGYIEHIIFNTVYL
jgi:hypothetical protein